LTDIWRHPVVPRLKAEPDPQKALALPAAKGDSLPDHVPTLTVLR
jgi:hypothetical protein